MKFASVLAPFVIAGLLIAAGCSKGYESQKKVGDLNITLSVNRYPLVRDNNTLNLKAADSSGKAVTDATVNVRYFMPPMPGMAPMDFTTQAMRTGDHYTFSANIPMEGGWKVEVSVDHQGKTTSPAIFNLDAR